MPEILDLDRIRAGWGAERRLLKLFRPEESDFGLGGLGSMTPEQDVRLVILPADPRADPLQLDQEVVNWLQKPRDAERRNLIGYGQTRTTSSAAVQHHHGEGQDWGWFMSIHRHGGIDASHSFMARVGQEGKFFFLREIVSFVWSCLDLQREAIEQWAIGGPFEVSLGLRETEGAFLTDFAEGWEPAFSIYRSSMPCVEPNVLLQWEIEHGFDPKDLALDVGARIENAFGSVANRCLARGGQYDGKFDPR